MSRWLALVVVFALAPITAEALCIPKFATPDKTDPFAYLDAVIDSLAWVKQGFDGVRKPNQDFGELLHAQKAAQGDYQCAARGLAVFAQSPDKIIGGSAGVLGDTYGLLVLATERSAAELVELLNQFGRGQSPGMGTITARLADLRVMMDDAWKMLPLAVIGTTYALPRFDGGNPTGRFRITSVQRQQLARELEKHFGPSVRVGMKAGQHALEGAAGALYGFLSDRKWRSLDEP